MQWQIQQQIVEVSEQINQMKSWKSIDVITEAKTHGPCRMVFNLKCDKTRLSECPLIGNF